MANNRLQHPDSDSYCQIQSRNLEALHFKIDQTHAVLCILSDWVIECDNCSLSLHQKVIVDSILFLLIEVMEQAKQLLPEV